MKVFIFVILSLFNFASAFGGGGSFKSVCKQDGTVCALDEKDFQTESFLADYLVMYFYDEGCKHCAAFNPKYQAAAIQLAELDNPKITMAKCHEPTCQYMIAEYMIQEFPTIKFWKNGVYQGQYSGRRETRDLVLHVTNSTGSLSRKADCSALRRLRKNKHFKFVMVSFGPVENNPYYDKVHLEVIKMYDYVMFKHNDDEACAKQLDIPYPSIAVFRKFDPQIVTYTGAAELDEFRKWWFQHKTPITFRLEDYNDVVFTDGYPVMIMFRSDAQKDDDFMAEYEDAARENQNKLMFSYQNMDSVYGQEMANRLQVGRHSLPAMRAFLNGQYKFNPNLPARNITSDQVTGFVNQLMNQELHPYWKSARPPYDNNASVFILTGDTYDKEVSNPDKEFLVFFTDNSKPQMLFWRALMYEVAEHYENVTDFVFAEVDQAHNEPQGASFEELPQIFYYGMGDNKKPVKMDPKEVGGNDPYHVCGWALRQSTFLQSFKNIHPEYIDISAPGLYKKSYFDDLAKQQEILDGKERESDEQIGIRDENAQKYQAEAARKGVISEESEKKKEL